MVLGIAAGGVAILLAVWLTPERVRDVSAVRIGFDGYTNVNGQRFVALIITNRSSFHIKKPYAAECRLYCEYCEYPNDRYPHEHLIYREPFGGGIPEIIVDFATASWGWWQLKRPEIPTISPGEEFRLNVPTHAESVSWHVTVPLRTIPFRDRLPYALQSRRPARQDDMPISFKLMASNPPPCLILASDQFPD